jgi:hypothetical protein
MTDKGDEWEETIDKLEKEIKLNHLSDLEYDENEERKNKEKKKSDVLLKGEDETKNVYFENFESKPIMADSLKINTIEEKLKDKKNVSGIQTNDLIYFLRMKSQNVNLNPEDMNKTVDYLRKVQISYFIENIFSNQSNYSSMVMAFVFLLIPFYYYYPRFYEGGFWGILIGIFGMTMLISCLQKYSNIGKLQGSGTQYFRGLPIYLFVFGLLFYGIFFVFMMKLNHISFFFISLIVVYLLMTYVLRLILLSPIPSNKFKNYRAKYEYNPNAIKMNTGIEWVCEELNKRLKLNMPSATMLYQYVAYFKIEKNKNYIGDFFSNMLQPLLSVGVLYMVGDFLNSYQTEVSNIPNDLNVEGITEGGGSKVQTIPIVGMNDITDKYIYCQANYILPDFVNYDVKIKKILTERCYDKDLQKKLTGVLQDIGGIYMNYYKPLFYYVGGDKKEVKMRMNQMVDEEAMKEEIRDKMDKLLVRDEKMIKENIPFIQSLIDTFCEEYEEVFKSGEHEFEYDENILGENIQSKNAGYVWMKRGLSMLSVWILWNKILGSAWVLSRYGMSYFGGFEKVLEYYRRDWLIWRYSTMGVDRAIFENMQIKEVDTSWWDDMKSFLLMIFGTLPFLTTLNNMIFGFQFSPKYWNYIWGILVIVNMYMNMKMYGEGQPLTQMNIIYVVISIIIMTVITVIMLNRKK